MRITLDLVTIDDDASTCKRVGSYQWLTLPDGTTCKRMDEKQMMRELSLTTVYTLTLALERS